MSRCAGSHVRFIICLAAFAITAVTTTPRDVLAQRAGSIDTISPTAARVGELVTIRGRGFGAFNVRVTVGGVPAVLVAANGSQVTFRVPDGVAAGTTQVVAANPGGQSGSISFRMLEGVLLAGAGTASAVSAMIDKPPVRVGPADIVDGTFMTRVDVRLRPGATVAQVNEALTRVDGGIVTMLKGEPVITIAIPRPATPSGLVDVADTLNSLPGISRASIAHEAQTKRLPAGSVGLGLTEMGHLVPEGFPAAWNASLLATDGCGSRTVTVLVADRFDTVSYPGFYNEIPSTSFHFLVPPVTTNTHGDEVTTTLAAQFDSSNPTGALPFPECLNIEAIAVDGFTGVQRTILLLQAFPAGKFLLNYSLGYPDQLTCLQAAGGCGPSDPQSESGGSAVDRAYDATDWKRFTSGFWGQFLLSVAGGNERDKAGTAIYPGFGVAAFDSPMSIATLPDPSFGFVQDRSQWDPQSQPGAGGFLSLAATPAEKSALDQYVQAFGSSASVVAENVLMVGAASSGSVPESLAARPYSDSNPDVFAVGENIYTLSSGFTEGGTSLATPQVTGLAAYLWLLSSGAHAKNSGLADLSQLAPSVTRQAILTNARVGLGVNVIDAYATVLSLDAATDVSPSTAPVRLALLDVNPDGVFDENDLAVFVNNYFDSTGNPVEPTDRTYGRLDLNGDGYTGGSRPARFDLDRVGSTQFGAAHYSQVLQNIGGDVAFDETQLTDVQILCYYAYSALYTGDPDERDRLLANRCTTITVTVAPPSPTVASGGTQQFSATVHGTPDPRVEWSATGGTISDTGLFTAGGTGGVFKVRATSVVDGSKFGEATVTVTSVSNSIAGVFLGTGPHNGNGPLVFQGSISFVDSNGLPIKSTSFEWPIADAGGFMGQVNTLVAGVSRFATYTISIGNTPAPVSLTVSLSAPVGNLSVGGSTCGSTFTVSAADVDMLSIQPQCNSTATVNVHDVNGSALLAPDHSTVTLNAQNIGLGQSNRGALFIGCAFTFGCWTVQSSTVSVQASALAQVSVTASNSSIKVNGQVQPWNVPGQCGINGSDAGCIPGIFLQGNSNTDLRAQLSGNVSFFLLDNNTWSAQPQISIGDEVVARDSRTTNLGLVSITNNRGLGLGGINGLDQITGDLRITGNIGFDDNAANMFAKARSVQGSVTISQNSSN
jgi:IPT/TIG domain-containing protein/subtilase family protein